MNKPKKLSAVECYVQGLENLKYNPLEKNGYDNAKQRLLEKAFEIEKEQMIALGKRCFYKGFEKAESDDANCFTAWREEAEELLTIKSE
jgi:hypothetical protein